MQPILFCLAVDLHGSSVAKSDIMLILYHDHTKQNKKTSTVVNI